jgi:hypothetical protein
MSAICTQLGTKSQSRDLIEYVLQVVIFHGSVLRCDYPLMSLQDLPIQENVC